MKYGVIDVGSNSVRLMISENGNTLYKKVNITRLSENMGEGFLQPEAVKRTVLAVSFFVNSAKNEKADCIFIFATAAVRVAKNREAFISEVKKCTGIDVDVLSEEREAFCGYMGALNGEDGGVIDIGGASTEIQVVKDKKTEYSISVKIGAVKLADICGKDEDRLLETAKTYIEQFGCVSSASFRGIGGTVTSLVSVYLGLEPYDPNKVDGFVLTKEIVISLFDKLKRIPIEKRSTVKGLQSERAKVILSGCAILIKVMETLKIDEVVVSEKDNLEGYLMERMGL